MQVEVNSAPASAPTLATVWLLPTIGLWDQGEGHHVRFRHGSLLRVLIGIAQSIMSGVNLMRYTEQKPYLYTKLKNIYLSAEEIPKGLSQADICLAGSRETDSNLVLSAWSLVPSLAFVPCPSLVRPWSVLDPSLVPRSWSVGLLSKLLATKASGPLTAPSTTNQVPGTFLTSRN
jgi:hypothetical protein